jgi:nucleotide-binding universal stress UspA family protein
MILNILVPVDFSESSLNALETAVSIAVKNSALLQLLYITETIEGYDKNNVAKNSAHVLTAMTASIRQKNGITVETVLKEGFVGPLILKTGIEKKADLIVMGTHGASGVRDLFIGSTAYYVIKNAICPVLTVPEGKKTVDFQKVLFPIRPIFGALKRYDFVRQLIKGNDHNCLVQVQSISSNKEDGDLEALTKMIDELKSNYPEKDIHFSVDSSDEKNVAEEVLKKADRIQADLIVITGTIDVVIKPFFIGPFSQRIIHHAKVPVLNLQRIKHNVVHR